MVLGGNQPLGGSPPTEQNGDETNSIDMDKVNLRLLKLYGALWPHGGWGVADSRLSKGQWYITTEQKRLHHVSCYKARGACVGKNLVGEESAFPSKGPEFDPQSPQRRKGRYPRVGTVTRVGGTLRDPQAPWPASQSSPLRTERGTAPE